MMQQRVFGNKRPWPRPPMGARPASAAPASKGNSRMDHKFKSGQRVKLDPKRMASNRHPKFEVVRLLPAKDGVNRYQIRSVWDQHERVVTEPELT